MASGLTVAVVQTTLKLLEERKFPVKALRAFASERSVGKTVTFKGETIRIGKVGPETFKGVDVALFSAGSAQSKEYAPQAVKAGAVVVDKSNAFRMDPQVPLVVPEINAHAVRGHRGIVACPNCTSIVTVMPLKPLHDGGRRQRGGGAAHPDARVGPGRGGHAAVLPAPDRVQRHPAHRHVRGRRLHRRGDEAGQRGPQDPR